MPSSPTSDNLTFDEAESILRSMAITAAVIPPTPFIAPILAPVALPASDQLPAPQSPPHGWHADRRYRALIEQIPVVTFMAALDQSIHELYVSPQIESLLGFSQKEWLDNPFLWYNQLHPDDRERWQNEFARTCTVGVQFRSEYRFIARDGRTVWVHGECQLIRDDAGRPLFLQGVAYDITENKRAQEALQHLHHDLENIVQQRTAQLAQANESLHLEIAQRQKAQQDLARQATELARSNTDLSQFAYVASHDLKEPLRMMASFAQLLSDRYQGKLDSNADEFIHFITDGAARMQRLIDDLLAYSRVSQGELPRAHVDCASALAQARANLQAAINDSAALVTADSLPALRGNEAQLVQLFQNLIGNALKFARPAIPPRVHVAAVPQDGHWLFSVRDNGIGFDPQHAQRIFLIFQRLHSRQEYPGTGIGLALCRKIVERHGGRIWAHSSPGSGSTFFFALPSSEMQK